MSALAPGFLVAVPQLNDPHFLKSVVLMLEYSPEGALGIVVNRPGRMSLAEVARLQGVRPGPDAERTQVFVGGPVQPERGFVLHDRAELAESVHLFERVHVSSSIDALRTLLEGSADHFRLCLGYAGWGPGQLEKELQEGSWIVSKADQRHVLQTPASQVWDAVLRDMGIDPLMLLKAGGLH